MKYIKNIALLILYLIYFNVLAQQRISNFNTTNGDFSRMGCEIGNSFYLFTDYNTEQSPSYKYNIRIFKTAADENVTNLLDISLQDTSITILNYKTVGNNILLYASGEVTSNNTKSHFLILIETDASLGNYSYKVLNIFPKRINALKEFKKDSGYLLALYMQSLSTLTPCLLFLNQSHQVTIIKDFPELPGFRLDELWHDKQKNIRAMFNVELYDTYFATIDSVLNIQFTDSLINIPQNYLKTPLRGRLQIVKEQPDTLLIIAVTDTLYQNIPISRFCLAKLTKDGKVVKKRSFVHPEVGWRFNNYRYYLPWQGIGAHSSVSNLHIGADLTNEKINKATVIQLDSNLHVNWQTSLDCKDSIVQLQYIYGSQFGGCWVVAVKYLDNNTPSQPDYEMELIKLNDLGYVTSVNKIDWNGKPLQVYPNPFNNVLHVKGNSCTNMFIQFWNLSGKLSMTTKIDDTGKVNTQQLEQGMYTYKIITTNGEVITTGKVVKH
jgi:hypothetical protein